MESKVSKIFGELVFDDRAMHERLPKDTYKKYKQTIQEGSPLDPVCANIIASAMKDWAIEKGATHYTHWFQPMTGITAEKHDSFITPSGNGTILMEFSGKELVQGEPDASSFPNGGLRATFEARGYTAWDPTSFAFIKEGVLCIPSAFCSYNGEALDKKTPLLKSQEVINKQALRIVRLFGNTTAKRVNTTVGPEQEYFLIDKKLYNQRKDLIYTGRTLFGAKPPKTQEMDDHYFGVLKTKVKAFMNDLNEELWKLGILAKTQHNEAAPAQHELAPIFTITNVATDHNQLTMEIMKKVALKHDMVCLLHEKPFEGINGSGKHNNWSMATDTGINLLEPGETPYENAQFLLVLSALIKAVDKNQDLLRISVASAGNDHRLGGHEAPPAIISIYLGDELGEIFECIRKEKPYAAKDKNFMDIAVDALPRFAKDTSDRNRTSPFAFTGNKFEFRMLGSQVSISCPNIMINTMVAEVLDEFASILEKSTSFEKDVHELIRKTICEHKRIIFNGNGYDDIWVKEAEKRGLLNLATTPDALPHYLDEKNVKLFAKYGIYTKQEMQSRRDIILEEYCKAVNIEAETMVNMTRKNIIPAIIAYSKTLSESVAVKHSIGISKCEVEKTLLQKMDTGLSALYQYSEELNTLITNTKTIENLIERSKAYGTKIIKTMEDLRSIADNMEQICAKDYWPFPSYGDLLYSVSM